MQNLSSIMKSASVFNTLHLRSCSLPKGDYVRISLSCLAPASTKVGFMNRSQDSGFHSSAPRHTEIGSVSFPTMILQARCRKSDLPSRSFKTTVYKLAGGKSNKGELVYRGPIAGMIKVVKVFSLSTSVIGLCLQPMIFSNTDIPSSVLLALGGMINFLVFLNPFIIHHIAKRYVTELWWNKSTDVFTAVTWSLFVQPRKLQFTANDVSLPVMSGLFTSVRAKGVPLFFDPQVFNESEAYVHMMGFDKPLNWELPKDSTEKRKEKTEA